MLQEQGSALAYEGYIQCFGQNLTKSQKPCLYNPLQTYNQQLIQPTLVSHNYTKLAYEDCDQKAREQDAKTVQIPFVFPPKITTNSPINKLLHHTFKGLAFGKRELSKREKKTVKTFMNPEFLNKTETFVLPFESKNIAFCLPLFLLTLEYLKALAQVPHTRSRF